MHNIQWLFALLSFLCAAAAADLELPVLSLPWGKYQGEVYANDSEIIIFRNVRFGAEPKRFDAPSFPGWKDDSIQDPNRNTTCIQVNTKKLKHPPGGKNPLEDPHALPAAQTEDCLFLDIYVPAWVFEEPADTLLPVVVWIYGGGYAFGAKDQGGPLYTGQPLLRASQYNSIFIAGNHRVGAFGWLAGDYMQTAGQPNAGLYDQALLFEWVQKHVYFVHGDNQTVSAWGESAGAGSILHHLVREGGTKDPLFHTYAAQSPGFEWAWDNSPGGKLDTMYRNFSRLAGCEFAYDIDCLRKAEVGVLAKANQDLFDQVQQTGLFPVGPSVDGKWIQTISTVAFSEGKYWKDCEGSLVTHVANEGFLFAPNDIESEDKYDQFLKELLPGSALEPQREAIKEQYNCKRDFLTYKLCVATLIGHAVFTCNTRDLALAYPSSTYMLEYEFPADGSAFHGSDLIPEFMNSPEEAEALLIQLAVDPALAKILSQLLESLIRFPYQTYFASFAVYGNPNTYRWPTQRFWPLVEDNGDEFTNVLRAKMGFSTESSFDYITDGKNSKAVCSFWAGIAKDIVGSKSADGGYENLQWGTQVPLDTNEL